MKATPVTGGVELSVPFAAPAAAAVFARGNVVWAVFAANADLKLDQTQFPAGYRARAIRQKDATILRIETPKGLSVSAEMDESVWSIRIAATANRPQRFLKPERKPDDSGRARIETMMIGTTGLVWFEDPVIGDQLAVAVAYGPSSSSPTPRDFVEASLPATAHGLAIAPKSDSVLVTLEGERVAVSMAAAAQSVNDTAVVDLGLGAAATNPAFIDFAAWGASRGEQYFEHLKKLQAAAIAADPSTPMGASAGLDLARFYLGHQQPHEALGILRMTVIDRPELEQDPTFVGMRGAANYMVGRLNEAEQDLSRGVLRGDQSAALWRAMIAAGRGEWERAMELFRESDRQSQLYPSARAADFAAAWAEAALQVNDFDAARRQANLAVSGGDPETKERGQLTLANLRAIVDGPAAAYGDFERIAMGGSSGGSRDARMRELISEKIAQASTKRTAPMVAEASGTSDAKPEPMVVTKAEAKPEPMVAAKAEPKPEPKPEPMVVTKPEPKVAAAKVEPKEESKAEAKAEPRFAVASATSLPVRFNPTAPPAEPAAMRSEPAATATPTQARVVVGSTEPIRPVLVKTLAVKAGVRTASLGALHVAAPAGEPQPAAAAALAPTPVAAAKPEAAAPPPAPVTAAKPEPSAPPAALVAAAKPEPAAPPPAPVAAAKPEPSAPPPAPVAAAKPEPAAPPPEVATKPEPAAELPSPGVASASPAAAASAPAAPAAKPTPMPTARPASAAPAAKPQHKPGWMIQVGAYPAEQAAKQRLSAVQSKASKMLTGAEAFTETIDKGGTTYYRARFAGLDKDKAEAACKYLKQNDVECVTIKN